MKKKDFNSSKVTEVKKGSCLCGAVKYEVHGPLFDVLHCHCRNCRKQNGHFSASTGCKKNDLKILGEENLAWYNSVKDVTKGVKRGFCSVCGSVLVWNPEDGDDLWFSAGSLDDVSGIKVRGHIWTSEKGDYYEISDGLPQYERDPDDPSL
jgi:hypothetical protein|tara:strand:+ start:524 stop:976 length:453 start_codon:yes stop_codon:yes gene_type:complete